MKRTNTSEVLKSESYAFKFYSFSFGGCCGRKGCLGMLRSIFQFELNKNHYLLMELDEQTWEEKSGLDEWVGNGFNKGLG